MRAVRVVDGPRSGRAARMGTTGARTPGGKTIRQSLHRCRVLDRSWSSDHNPSTFADKNGVYYRNAWDKFSVKVTGGKTTAKDMHDERGYRSFEILPNHEGLPDIDRIVPAYFRSLDKKMQYLNDQGMVPLLETVRRDNCPPWAAYFDFNESYTRFVQYMVARYGAYNMVFSKILHDEI
ncbi:hypothetical protein ACFL6U_13460 [Planctomycetota bacterium]